ncbi:hypothetical protein OAO37_06620, partial [Planktomarina temperata]|nr:hypothetical protein [Planktomarina temperata]
AYVAPWTNCGGQHTNSRVTVYQSKHVGSDAQACRSVAKITYLLFLLKKALTKNDCFIKFSL